MDKLHSEKSPSPEISSAKDDIKLQTPWRGKTIKIPKQAYTLEFKEQAVKRVRDGQSISVVVKELGLGDQTLRNWVKAGKMGN